MNHRNRTGRPRRPTSCRRPRSTAFLRPQSAPAKPVPHQPRWTGRSTPTSPTCPAIHQAALRPHPRPRRPGQRGRTAASAWVVLGRGPASARATSSPAWGAWGRTGTRLLRLPAQTSRPAPERLAALCPQGGSSAVSPRGLRSRRSRTARSSACSNTALTTAVERGGPERGPPGDQIAVPPTPRPRRQTSPPPTPSGGVPVRTAPLTRWLFRFFGVRTRGHGGRRGRRRPWPPAGCRAMPWSRPRHTAWACPRNLAPAPLALADNQHVKQVPRRALTQLRPRRRAGCSSSSSTRVDNLDESQVKAAGRASCTTCSTAPAIC